MRVMIWLAVLVGVGAALAWAAQPRPMYSPDERKEVVAFWSVPGRYAVAAPPEASTDGPWQVRFMTDASVWFRAYTAAVAGQEKTPPSVDAKGATPETQVWEDWVTAKVALDKWEAQRDAARANAEALGRPAPPDPDAPPPAPGDIPPGLLAAAGDPPAFYAPVAPTQATVTYPDGETFTYQDNVKVRDRFAYYRFPQGTVSYGTALSKMTDAELDPVFAVGMSPSEARVAKAVSKMEGGFDAVNTYDTGYVSVGFIQFITGSDGTGSLLEVLQREKRNSITGFALDFRRYGIEVTPDGVLAVVDPDTGAELTGPDAVMAVVRDRRLISAFQRAGRHSADFRAAQVQVARAHYWPANDPVTVTVNGQALSGKVSDIVHSEAGLATLFDRKVNRGNIRPFADVVAQVMMEHHLTALDQAAAHEREIIAALKYRHDFLQDPTLGQPPVPTG